jgi:hypothetical protein
MTGFGRIIVCHGGEGRGGNVPRETGKKAQRAGTAFWRIGGAKREAKGEAEDRNCFEREPKKEIRGG